MKTILILIFIISVLLLIIAICILIIKSKIQTEKELNSKIESNQLTITAFNDYIIKIGEINAWKEYQKKRCENNTNSVIADIVNHNNKLCNDTDTNTKTPATTSKTRTNSSNK